MLGTMLEFIDLVTKTAVGENICRDEKVPIYQKGVGHLVKNSSTSTGHEGSLPCSQKRASGT
jgi:hypothetical protein